MNELFTHILTDIKLCPRLEDLKLIWEEVAYFQSKCRTESNYHLLNKLIDELLNKREIFYEPIEIEETISNKI